MYFIYKYIHCAIMSGCHSGMNLKGVASVQPQEGACVFVQATLLTEWEMTKRAKRTPKRPKRITKRTMGQPMVLRASEM